MKSRKLILFDFDGTLTTRDTLFAFTRFVAGDAKFFLGLVLLSPYLLAHRFKFITAHRAKEIFLSYFLKGLSQQEFESFCNRFATEIVPSLIRPRAGETIQMFQREDAEMFIVSASAENWINPWARAHGMVVIATQLEFVNNRLTGKIRGENCNGAEKVIRIRREINLSDYTDIIAYGDSDRDKPMLQLATQSYFKPFRDKN